MFQRDDSQKKRCFSGRHELKLRAHATEWGSQCRDPGLIMALMGVLQLAFLVRFLSRPALSGVLAIL